MALGPRLDLRQSQSLVMTPQLQQAIRLLALSNLEIESFIAEEIERNPLLDSGGDDDGGAPEAPVPEMAEAGDGPSETVELVESGDAIGDSPLDMDYDSETFHQDSAADSMRGLDGGLGMDGISGGGSATGGEMPDYRQLRRQAGLACRPSLGPGRRDLVRRRSADRRARSSSRSTRPAISGRPCSTSPSGSACALAEVERVLAHRPDLRSRRGRRAHARRMPGAAGEGRRPLRSGDGAADRQSRLSRQGQSRRAAAHLRGRRRGSRRHDPRAARLRSQAGLPFAQGEQVDAVVPDVFVARRAQRLGDRAQQRDPAAAAGQPLLLYRAVERRRRTSNPRPGCRNASPAPTG